MIVTKKRPLAEIKEELEKKPISIVSCSVCASICKTGGLRGAIEIKTALEEEGFSVLDDKSIVPVCSRDLKERMQMPRGEQVVVLACDAGMLNIEKLCAGKKVISGNDTIGLGIFNKSGEIKIVREFK